MALVSRLDWIRHYLLTRGRTYRYGPDRSQRGDLHLPPGAGPHPVIVLIHGGSWGKKYGRVVMRGRRRRRSCAAAARRGTSSTGAIGDGGGWPQTFDDVAAAIDLLGGLDRRSTSSA